MHSLIFAMAMSLIVAVLWYFCLRFWMSYRKYRGVRVITCPETRAAAAVEVNARRAGWTHISGDEVLQLKNCSRWPERRDCGQECLSQVEAAPEDCLVRNLLMRWYEGKSCALCHEPFKPIEHWDHKPALRDPSGMTKEWSDIPPEQIPRALATHQPVCWNCHVAETFRRLFPDLIVDRPERWVAGARRR